VMGLTHMSLNHVSCVLYTWYNFVMQKSFSYQNNPITPCHVYKILCYINSLVCFSMQFCKLKKKKNLKKKIAKVTCLKKMAFLKYEKIYVFKSHMTEGTFFKTDDF
jgi:HJR/Mrr/RecB family endonuclease